MRAHLDFVMTERASSRILFAVEYDGVEHFTDADTIQRDRKKKEVCRALGFDLLRVTKCQLEAVFLGRNQLQLLVERWFNAHIGSQGRTRAGCVEPGTARSPAIATPGGNSRSEPFQIPF